MIRTVFYKVMGPKSTVSKSLQQVKISAGRKQLSKPNESSTKLEPYELALADQIKLPQPYVSSTEPGVDELADQKQLPQPHVSSTCTELRPSCPEPSGFETEWKLHITEVNCSMIHDYPPPIEMITKLESEITILGSNDSATIKHRPSNKHRILTKEEITTIQSLLIQMRLLEGKTQIENRLDTSLRYYRVTIQGHLTIDSSIVPFKHKMGVQCLGFQGKDAGALTELLFYFEELLSDKNLYKSLRRGYYGTENFRRRQDRKRAVERAVQIVGDCGLEGQWEFSLQEHFIDRKGFHHYIMRKEQESLVTKIRIVGSSNSATITHSPSNKRRDLEKEQITIIQSLLIQMKLLEGMTQIRGVSDSSPDACRVTIKGHLKKHGSIVPFEFVMKVQYHGFTGEDAEAFSQLLFYFEELFKRNSWLNNPRIFNMLKYGDSGTKGAIEKDLYCFLRENYKESLSQGNSRGWLYTSSEDSSLEDETSIMDKFNMKFNLKVPKKEHMGS